MVRVFSVVGHQGVEHLILLAHPFHRLHKMWILQSGKKYKKQHDCSISGNDCHISPRNQLIKMCGRNIKIICLVIITPNCKFGFYDHIHDMKNPDKCPGTGLYLPYVKLSEKMAGLLTSLFQWSDSLPDIQKG